jgi:hypothetical protein
LIKKLGLILNQNISFQNIKVVYCGKMLISTIQINSLKIPASGKMTFYISGIKENPNQNRQEPQTRRRDQAEGTVNQVLNNFVQMMNTTLNQPRRVNNTELIISKKKFFLLMACILIIFLGFLEVVRINSMQMEIIQDLQKQVQNIQNNITITNTTKTKKASKRQSGKLFNKIASVVCIYSFIIFSYLKLRPRKEQIKVLIRTFFESLSPHWNIGTFTHQHND